MDLDGLARIRHEYQRAGLAEDDVDADPYAQFAAWFGAWRELAVGEPEAMVVATATPDGRPSSRTVLLRAFGPERPGGGAGPGGRPSQGGFVFFTNYESRKGRELAANPRVSLLFSWHPVGRQVVVDGRAEHLPAEASDAYWATRPRESRLAARSSPQSRVVPDRATLERRFAAEAERHAGADVPRPASWGGYRVVPDSIEFWQGREHRAHDRLVYRRGPSAPTGWRLERLAP